MEPSTALAPGPSEGLCLDFANTRYWRGSPAPTEELDSPADLLAWFQHARVLDAASLRQLGQRWGEAPSAAKAELREALALREAIFASFAAAGGGAAPPEAALDTLNAALGRMPERHRLERGETGWAWVVPPVPLAPVLWS